MTIQTYPATKSQVTSNFWRYTAVGGETSLSGVDNSGTSLYYYPNQEQVYLNGILLVRGVDYTATSGTSIVGLATLTAGDSIQVNCYSNFTITQVPVTSLQGSITNLQLANSTITIGGQTINLGGSQSTFSGITLTSPTINNQIAGTGYSTSVPLTVKGASGQTSNLQEWQDSTASVKAYISSVGNINTSGGITIGNNNSGTVYRLNLAGLDANHSIYSTGSSGNNMYFNEYGSFIFYNTQYSAEKMRIDSNGYVGINTSTLGSRYLTVNGNTAIWGSTPLRLGEASNTYYYDMGRDTNTGNFIINGNQTGSLAYVFQSAGSAIFTIGSSGVLFPTNLIVGRTNNGGSLINSNDSGTLSVRGDATNAAAISFHRPNIYAINMGLDTDNIFKIGGWSAAAPVCMSLDGAGNMILPGYLLIGYTTSVGGYKLQVNGSSYLLNGYSTSDKKYKKNIKSLSGGIDLVKALKPVEFDWIQQKHITDKDGKVLREKHEFPEHKNIGFIAQDIQEVLKDKDWLKNIVSQNTREAIKDENGKIVVEEESYLAVSEMKLVPVLVQAIQELTARLEKLEAK